MVSVSNRPVQMKRSQLNPAIQAERRQEAESRNRTIWDYAVAERAPTDQLERFDATVADLHGKVADANTSLYGPASRASKTGANVSRDVGPNASRDVGANASRDVGPNASRDVGPNASRDGDANASRFITPSGRRSVLNPAIQAERREQASRGNPTIADFGVAAYAPASQLAEFDATVGHLHNEVAYANADIYGDALPAHLAPRTRAPESAGVQMKADADTGLDTDEIQAAAARGVQGRGGRLPHFDKIQSAFGDHDLSDVAAHVGGSAREASDAMGAEAYATGNAIAFRDTPSLHTAAHEAAHIIQQRAGVSLQGGVGQAGDTYERQADAIADAVVAGRSVEGLLGAQSSSAQASGVQRAPSVNRNRSKGPPKPSTERVPADIKAAAKEAEKNARERVPHLAKLVSALKTAYDQLLVLNGICIREAQAHEAAVGWSNAWAAIANAVNAALAFGAMIKAAKPILNSQIPIPAAILRFPNAQKALASLSAHPFESSSSALADTVTAMTRASLDVASAPGGTIEYTPEAQAIVGTALALVPLAMAPSAVNVALTAVNIFGQWQTVANEKDVDKAWGLVDETRKQTIGARGAWGEAQRNLEALNITLAKLGGLTACGS